MPADPYSKRCEMGAAPRTRIRPTLQHRSRPRRREIGGNWYWLRKPLDLATETDLDPANWEA